MEAYQVLSQLESDYPQYMHLVSNATTVDGHVMPTYAISLAQNYKELPIFYLTALIHGNEPLSLSLLLYYTLTQLQYLLLKNETYLSIFKKTALFITPVVNVDAYYKFGVEYNKTSNFQDYRKNRNHGNVQCPRDWELGTDLNRNFAHYFGMLNGSSGFPCNQEYRGEHEFSEIETAEIKSIIDNHPSIQSVISLHSFGDMLLFPLNSSSLPKSERYAAYLHYMTNVPTSLDTK